MKKLILILLATGMASACARTGIKHQPTQEEIRIMTEQQDLDIPGTLSSELDGEEAEEEESLVK